MTYIRFKVPSNTKPGEYIVLDFYSSKTKALRVAKEYAITYKCTVFLENEHSGTTTRVDSQGKVHKK